MNAAPGILESRRENEISSTILAKQWKKLYEAGKAQNPPIAAITAAAFFYLAWSVRSGRSLVRGASNLPTLYGSAAVLTLSIVPYTIVAMSKTNAALLTKATGNSKVAEKASADVDELVQNWISLNTIRGLLPLVGGLVGIFAALP
ncbi:hypothetical protein PDIG_05230 [Penicillium digitatum PHI26]|uniref:DUF1772-domain-containing protein n=3 Tax=Penicillium digitatum TaxID=36651 RepID=K9H1M1_PEND2|nr:hypothetical protein PDIP_09900 [Penicillium digitatum Pd1]EKV19026.1 hypothetical protein PDIG_05230 [Penicillium digitatum PHI26]EKV21090.1 hypothetical protein PDIP_09900 [Penicillium digitatum Pd1]KAG0154000.1 hypothetical protein PDIDSM_1379 [Penicillium digitatum]